MRGLELLEAKETIMDNAQPSVGEQTALWNGTAGKAWVESQELLDQMLQPFEDLLVDVISAETAGRVLDVGCGTGSTTLAVARRLGPKVKGGGQLRFVAWRSAVDNPFMTTAERAAAPFLPNLPARRPDEPGQFAFADRDRVRRILEDSGWSDIDLQPIDVPCTMPEPALVPYVTRLGPVGRALP